MTGSSFTFNGLKAPSASRLTTEVAVSFVSSASSAALHQQRFISNSEEQL